MLRSQTTVVYRERFEMPQHGAWFVSLLMIGFADVKVLGCDLSYIYIYICLSCNDEFGIDRRGATVGAFCASECLLLLASWKSFGLGARHLNNVCFLACTTHRSSE